MWPIEPHTVAKHEILRRYLTRWIPIMASRNPRIVYIDGFAGPGKYLGGEDGSSIIALKVAGDFVERGTLKAKQLAMYLVEPHADRHDLLESEIRALRESDVAYQGIGVTVVHSEYTTAMDDIWKQLETAHAKLAPTFAFIDPFGVSGTPFEHVVRLLSNPKTEVLINLMYEEANRFLTTPEFEGHLDAFFGDASWRRLIDIPGSAKRRDATIELFKQRLRAAGAKYVQVFEMKNQRNQTDYLLFFGTHSDKGLEVMKEAMWRVDSSGTFSLSDYTHAKGPMLIEPSPNYDSLQDQLRDRFHGKEVGMQDIRLFVLAETSFFHYKREALKPMEASGLIEVIPAPGKRRRAGTYADDVRIKFS